MSAFNEFKQFLLERLPQLDPNTVVEGKVRMHRFDPHRSMVDNVSTYVAINAPCTGSAAAPTRILFEEREYGQHVVYTVFEKAGL